MKDAHFDEDGNIIVNNPEAFWLPEIKITKEIHGTIYNVTGSYDGIARLDQKLSRILQKEMEGKP
ncbi:MAG: hypothetical protein IKS29_06085 [Oscillospiraceae bacterium]|nr:hypothetical protein [Oscillospiraceae bacterium]